MICRDPRPSRARLGELAIVVIILLSPRSSPLSAQSIHDLVRRGDTAAITLLLKRDPSLIEAKEAGDFTPLKTAVQSGGTDMVRFLLRHGAKASQPHRGFFTPLEYAVRRDDLATARLLLEAGADPNTLNTEDATAPLQMAAAGDDEMVRDNAGHTPMDIALAIQRRLATPLAAETIEILRRAIAESSKQR